MTEFSVWGEFFFLIGYTANECVYTASAPKEMACILNNQNYSGIPKDS